MRLQGQPTNGTRHWMYTFRSSASHGPSGSLGLPVLLTGITKSWLDTYHKALGMAGSTGGKRSGQDFHVFVTLHGLWHSG